MIEDLVNPFRQFITNLEAPQFKRKKVAKAASIDVVTNKNELQP